MRRLVFATRNQGKLRELSALVAPLALEIVSAAELQAPEVVEDGQTFAENAAKKASVVAAATSLPALADDSGLVVDALEGAPGVHSARFAGPRATDAENNLLLLQRLQGVAPRDRTAAFVCVMAFVDPGASRPGEVLLAEGRCHGRILEEARGEGGFGYDPLFWVPERGRTFAELGSEVKNSISHRAMAMREMLSLLRPSFG